MRYGIPEFKMEKSVLDRRIEQMEDEGTNFRCGVEVGVKITGSELRALRRNCAGRRVHHRSGAAGSRPRTRWHSPGDGVPAASQPRRAGTHVDNQITAKDKHVVIIGGGDTGADCLGTAIRQQPKSIVQLEIMPTPPDERPEHQPWPTYPMIYRVSSAHEEAGERVYSVSTSEFIGDYDDNVASLRMSEVRFEGARSSPSKGPRRRFRPSWFCSRWVSLARRGTRSYPSWESPSMSAAMWRGTRTMQPMWVVFSSAAMPVAVSR